MNPFTIREKEIFETLKKIKDKEFVVIGGYAVNAYTLPRFSIDCDIVVKDKQEAEKIAKILEKIGYKKNNPPENAQYTGNFQRYEKELENKFRVSMDILIEKVIDRQTKATFTSEWIFNNSKKSLLKGKTLTEQIQARIINIDALIVMKIISCRQTDIRDVFMMFPNSQNKEWIKSEISKRYNLDNRLEKIMKKITSKQFKDGLSGVYGFMDNKLFEKHKKSISSLKN